MTARLILAAAGVALACGLATVALGAIVASLWDRWRWHRYTRKQVARVVEASAFRAGVETRPPRHGKAA